MKKILVILFLFLSTLKGEAVENPKIILKTVHGDVKIELFKDVAPNHVNRKAKIREFENWVNRNV